MRVERMETTADSSHLQVAAWPQRLSRLSRELLPPMVPLLPLQPGPPARRRPLVLLLTLLLGARVALLVGEASCSCSCWTLRSVSSSPLACTTPSSST